MEQQIILQLIKFSLDDNIELKEIKNALKIFTNQKN